MTKTRETVAQPSAEFTIAGRTYELMPFLKEDESSVTGDVMVERAQELNANLSKEDGAFVLEHQDEIPEEFRGNFYLVFTAWRRPSNPQRVASLYWHGRRWCQYWIFLDDGWGEHGRLVRRRT